MAVLFLSDNPKFSVNRLYAVGYAFVGNNLHVDSVAFPHIYLHSHDGHVTYDFVVPAGVLSTHSNTYTLDHYLDLANSYIYLDGVPQPYGTFVDYGYAPVTCEPRIFVRPTIVGTSYNVVDLPPVASPWYVPPT